MTSKSDRNKADNQQNPPVSRFPERVKTYSINGKLSDTGVFSGFNDNNSYLFLKEICGQVGFNLLSLIV